MTGEDRGDDESVSRRRWTRRGFVSVVMGATATGCLRAETGSPTNPDDETPGTTNRTASSEATQTTTLPQSRPTGISQEWSKEFVGWVSVVQSALDDETVIVAGENGVRAVAPSTGERVWGASTAWIRPLPAISSTTVYAAGQDGTLYALARSDGSTRWTFEGDTGLTTPPLLLSNRDRLVVGAGQSDGQQVGAIGDSKFDSTYLYVLGTDGSRIWSVETANGNPVTATATHNDRLYLRTVNRIEAYSLTDGTRAWQIGVNDVQWDNVPNTTYRAKRMFADENGVYVPTKDGVTALASDGSRRWRFEPFARPQRYQIDSGTLYIGAADNAVYAVNTTDGSQMWRTQLDGAVNVLVHDSDNLWTGTEPGTVSLLLPASGETRFTQSAGDSITSGDVVGDSLVLSMSGREFLGFTLQYP